MACEVPVPGPEPGGPARLCPQCWDAVSHAPCPPLPSGALHSRACVPVGGREKEVTSAWSSHSVGVVGRRKERGRRAPCCTPRRAGRVEGMDPCLKDASAHGDREREARVDDTAAPWAGAGVDTPVLAQTGCGPEPGTRSAAACPPGRVAWRFPMKEIPLESLGPVRLGFEVEATGGAGRGSVLGARGSEVRMEPASTCGPSHGQAGSRISAPCSSSSARHLEGRREYLWDELTGGRTAHLPGVPVPGEPESQGAVPGVPFVLHPWEGCWATLKHLSPFTPPSLSLERPPPS